MQKYLSKAVFCIAAVLLSCSNLFSQQIIGEAGIKFSLNDSLWKHTPPQFNKEQNATIYRYSRSAIETQDGNKVIPAITVIVESMQDSFDVMVFSAMKRVKMPFDIEEVITPDKGLLQYQNAIGYRAGYTDRSSVRHTIIIIYLVNKTKGVQVVMDITRDLFDEYRGEFDEVIRSIEVL